MKKNYVLRSLLAIILLFIGINTSWAEEVTYTVASTTSVNVSGTAPEGSLATFKNTYTTTKEQLTANNSMTLTLSGYAGCKITGITLSMKSNSKKGSGSFTAVAGETTISNIATSAFNSSSWNGSYTTSYVDVSPTVTEYEIASGENLVLTIAATVNSLYCQSFTITYETVGGGEEDTTPVLEADVDALSFKAAPGATTDAQTVELTVKNLDAVSYTCDNAAFAVTDNGDNTYDVTFTAPAEVGTTTGTLTFTAGELTATVALTGVASNSVTDVLNREFTTVTSGSTTYTDWTGTGASGAVYEGKSAGGNDAIQLRSSGSNSGIVTTTSGGKVLSVTVTWHANTSAGRTLNVYGKNTAYTAATDLFSTTTQGTLLGTIVKGTSTTLTIDGDYEYIGLCSKSGAMYLSEIQIEWAAASSEPADPTEVTDPTFDPAAGEVKSGTVVTISTNSGSTLTYTVNGGETITTETNTAEVTITEETTIEAFAVAADGETMSEVVSATYTIKQTPTYENIAAFIAAAPAEEAVLSGTVTVTYQNGSNLFVTDATGSLLVYGVSGTYTNGQTLTGITGTYTLYNGLPEMTNVTLPEAVAGDAVEPTVMTVDEVKNLEAKDYSRYIKLEGVEVTESTIGDITLYNKFGIELTTGTNCTVVGIVSYYNALQIYPIEITAIEDVTKLDAPTFNPAPGAVAMGTEVTISTIEGATLVYTINSGAILESADNTAVVTINEDTEIEVYAKMDGYTDSDVVTVNYTVVVPAAAGEYELVTDASKLAVGDKIVIVAAEYDYAISTTQNTNNRVQAAVTKATNNTVTFGDDVQVIYLQAGSAEGTFGFYVPGTIDGEETVAGYLYAASTSGNQLKTRDALEDDGKADWTITIAEGVTSIVAQGADEGLRDDLKYNTSSDLFSCYATGSTQKDVVVYRMVRYEENIVSNNCYAVAVGTVWDEPEGCWYAAKFVNKNSDAYTWSAVANTDDDFNGYIFYLDAGNTPVMRAKAEDAGYTYTHVEFVQLPSTVAVPENIQEIDLTGVDYKTTGEVYYDATGSTTYDLATGEWKDLGTGIEAVEAAGGIVYAGNVVYTEGTIVVYNLSGAVVARGENVLDLNGFANGVYVVRSGNSVLKVVR